VNAVIGLDFVAAENFTSIPIPKYNNKVQNPDIFDKSTRVVLPQSMLKIPTSSGNHNSFFTYSLTVSVDVLSIFKSVLVVAFNSTIAFVTGIMFYFCQL